MSSSFTWLDYSEHERRCMLDVVDAFKQKDTRDELGIGAVRDAFADMFFPGMSTIQTRARYFFFIPWIHLDLERHKTPSGQVAGRARQQEVRLIDALADSDDLTGIIGIDARKSLKRLPSSIYWQGLGTWGVRLFPGSQSQYHRSLDQFYTENGRQLHNDDKEPIDGRMRMNWHPGLPPAPKDFPAHASFALSKQEATYLRERILARARDTLLAFLVDQGRAADPTEFPWEHPQFGAVPKRIREQLEHSRNFSEVIHGASLLYNLMLAQRARNKQWISEYRERLTEWGNELDHARLARWDRRRFWEIVTLAGAKIYSRTRSFVDDWLDIAMSKQTARSIATNAEARRMIHDRERYLKRDLARLDHARALELWSGAAGTRQLNYRWQIAQTIVADILHGLGER